MKEANKRIVAMATSLGFILARTKRHFVFKHPNGATFVAPQSVSDDRALRNAEKDMHKAISNANARRASQKASDQQS
jgi:predicted RNA binding protein YcfA (HicA-like mRNA interferase family)